jgi:hypothetical protein
MAVSERVAAERGEKLGESVSPCLWYDESFVKNQEFVNYFDLC